MMQLLDRYLNAVRFWLTGAEKDDIIAELSDDLRSAIADEEQALGHPLTNDDMVRLLKRRGHPMAVAAGYLPQRSLIGPVLFPVYVLVLKIIALCFIAPWIATWAAILFGVPGVSGTHQGLVATLAAVWAASWTGLVGAIGIVTMVFAAIERLHTGSRLFQDWDPRKLPRAFTEIPRSTSAFEVAALITFGIWWVHFMSSRDLVFGSSVRITLTPLWGYFFWGVLVLTSLSVVLSATNLTRPYWTSRRAMLRLACNAGNVALWCAALRIGLVTTISVASVPAARTTELVRQLNLWSERALPLAIVVSAFVLAVDARRVQRLRRRGVESMTPARA
jgi:hypothetical protein